MIDSSLEPEARRLVLAAALTGRTRRALAGRVPVASTASELVALARQLGEQLASFERSHGLRYMPAYPGITAGPQSIGDNVRLVLACAVYQADGTPLGVVLTSLITGRFVQVAVAPPETPLPSHWHPLSSHYG
ncbi:MAG: hypothetical protein NVSMB6_17610 [Burkholderiaceae bacterium]